MAVTQRYAALLQPNIATYHQWIREELEIGDLFATTPLLDDAQRETLALGRFLWKQTEYIRATNYAGPTLLFTGVLEELTRVTFFKVTGRLTTEEGRPLQDTLGTIGNSTRFGGRVWRILEASVVGGNHWALSPTLGEMATLAAVVEKIASIAWIRNDAAHRATVSAKQFRKLCTYFFGDGSAPGAFNAILLARRAESSTLSPNSRGSAP